MADTLCRNWKREVEQIRREVGGGEGGKDGLMEGRKERETEGGREG